MLCMTKLKAFIVRFVKNILPENYLFQYTKKRPIMAKEKGHTHIKSVIYDNSTQPDILNNFVTDETPPLNQISYYSNSFVCR